MYDAKNLQEMQELFFLLLNLPHQKITNKQYLELLTIKLGVIREFTVSLYKENNLENVKHQILDMTLYWATGWDWDKNKIPDRCIEPQNKIRKLFGQPELTEEQINSYEFTNGDRNWKIQNRKKEWEKRQPKKGGDH